MTETAINNSPDSFNGHTIQFHCDHCLQNFRIAWLKENPMPYFHKCLLCNWYSAHKLYQDEPSNIALFIDK